MSMTNSTVTSFKQGEVWLCKVYWGDKGLNKIRPIVIVNNDQALDIDVVAAPITTQGPRNEFDVELKFWKEAGLASPSYVRTSKPLTVPGTFPIKKLGSLHQDDLVNVIAACKKVF